MVVEVVDGAAATALMGSAALLDDWWGLYKSTPDACVFQSPDFLRPWYDVSLGATPLIAFERSRRGRMVAAWFLARSASGAVYGAGGAEAKTHCWLAPKMMGAFFGQCAFEQLVARGFVDSTVSFRVPLGAPIGWTRRYGSTNQRQESESLVFKVNPERAAKPLEKRGSVSQLPRLRELGPVSLVEVTPEEVLRDLDRWAIHDVTWSRDAAMRRVLTPSTVRFVRRLAELRSPILRVTALQAGDVRLTFAVTYQDDLSTHLVRIVHDPIYESLSPAVVHLLMLEERFVAAGVDSMTLTEDTGWPHLFCEYVPTPEIEISLDLATRVRRRSARQLLRLATRLMGD